MCKQQEKLNNYRKYINYLISEMNNIDDNKDNEQNISEEAADIFILKDLVDLEVENFYFIHKEHSDFRTRRYALLFFHYRKYLQFMEEIGIENNLRTDIFPNSKRGNK